MKEHPIIFSSESVKAILAGQKTQTRRVVKPQPSKNTHHLGKILMGGTDRFRIYEKDDEYGFMTSEHDIHCPYGQVGDRLWVREMVAISDSGGRSLYRSDCVEDDSDERGREGWWENDRFIPGKIDWTPSIFMPRWASRITLEITGIRVEWLQVITEEDAIAEAVPTQKPGYAKTGIHPRYVYLGMQNITAREGFSLLWDHLNAKRGYPWSSNPWVWVIEFAIDNGENALVEAELNDAIAELEVK